MMPLTLVLPLKGRRLHTLRFFWHANRQRLPYRIIVADGQVEPAIAGRLSPPHALFPALDIDYAAYPDDSSYQHYFDKLASVLARVDTPYAMLCDNDDFIVRTGVAACMSFLDRHRDYAGISGGVAGFALHPGRELSQVMGVIRSLGSMYHEGYKAADYNAGAVAERVRLNFVRGYSLYYSVFRTEVLARVLREMAEIGFGDLKAAETFFGARVKTLGRCRLTRRVVSYVRQSGTSGGAPDIWTLDDVRGSGPHADEVNRCLAALARAIVVADGGDEQDIVADLRRLFIDKLAAEASSRATTEPAPGWRDGLYQAALALAPSGAIALWRRLLRRRAREEIAASMRAHGASTVEVDAVRQELLAIEATLEDPDFPAFLRRHAPDLLGENAGQASAKPTMAEAAA